MACLGSREKGMVAKCGFARCAPQRLWGFEAWVGVVVTCRWEPRELGGEISAGQAGGAQLEAQVREHACSTF